VPTTATVIFFLLGSLGILLLPGPNVLYILTYSATQGRHAGLASVGGIGLASLTHVAAAALGLSALLLTSALAFSVVKDLGAAYLIYLGVRTLLTRTDSHQTLVPAPKSLSRLFTQGFLVNLLNPKAALIFYAFLPQFVDPNKGAVTGQMLFFGVLFILLASCTDGLYVLLGSTLGKVLTGNIHFRQGQRYVTGGIYLVLGVAATVSSSERK
jgi:threonine/homoserine/homoserine lactone efflux protein